MMWPTRATPRLFAPILSSREQAQMGHVSSDRARLAFACAALVAVVAAFPLGFLNGAAAFWRYPKGDFAQHIVCGRYFIADAWRLPPPRLADAISGLICTHSASVRSLG